MCSSSLMSKEQISLIRLIRAVFSRCEVMLPAGVNWGNVIQIADTQGVLAVCYDAIGVISRTTDEKVKGSLPDIDSLMDWMAKMEHQKSIYNGYVEKLSALADFYQQHGIKMLLMKGYGLSLDYPAPSGRPVGDIDIYLFDEKERADLLMEQKMKTKVKRENNKHSAFIFKGVTVENHGKFVNDETHKSNIRLDEILKKQLAMDGVIECPIPNCYLPSDTWNALFLVRHAGEHFATNEITLRHVLDLATFFLRHHEQVDWQVVLKVYEDEGMMPFYDAIATICVRDFGIDARCFKGYHHAESVADRVLADIFSKKKELPMNMHGIHGIGKLKYGIQKTIRWWNNRWKYKMVYRETMWQSYKWLALNRIRK